MKKAIRMHATGGPEVLRWEDVPVPEPGPGEALIRQHAVGLNYIDVYFRTGLYKVPSLPAVIGQEGAGVVVAIGADVTHVAVGDRVAYAGGLGAYAQYRVAHADRLVRLPDDVGFEQAASVMLQGLTAEYLLHRTYPVKKGETILIHAAAGGVGLLLCQWAHHIGATVIGVVSTDAKAALARDNGAAHVVIGHQNLVPEVKRITHGDMVPVVYDSVGKDTFDVSLSCLAPLGLMVSFGNASGAVPPFELSLLSAKGSLFVTRPTLATYIVKRAELERAAGALLGAVASGVLRTHINQTLPLSEAAAAHRALEARETTGSTVLIP
jgi:NADPH2:quinone reductase